MKLHNEQVVRFLLACSNSSENYEESMRLFYAAQWEGVQQHGEHLDEELPEGACTVWYDEDCVEDPPYSLM